MCSKALRNKQCSNTNVKVLKQKRYITKGQLVELPERVLRGPTHITFQFIFRGLSHARKVKVRLRFDETAEAFLQSVIYEKILELVQGARSR